MLNALFNKGVNLANLSRYDEAILCYDHFLKIHPGNADALNNTGSCLCGVKEI